METSDVHVLTPITITDLPNLVIVRRLVDSGEFADAAEVITRALSSLEIQVNLKIVRALIEEAEVSVAEHGTIPWTPTLFDEILAEARPIDPDTSLPWHLRAYDLADFALAPHADPPPSGASPAVPGHPSGGTCP